MMQEQNDSKDALDTGALDPEAPTTSSDMDALDTDALGPNDANAPATQAATPKRASRAKKIVLWVIGIIVGLIVVVLVGFNIYMRATYSAFYADTTEEFEIPGIHAGFICQDLDYYDEADCWFFSGYASGDGSSPLYRRNADGSSVKFFAQLPDGSPYTGHGSGITTSSEYAFLTCDSGYLVFHAADLANVESGDVVTAIDQVDLELTPAFMNIENGTLYVGTFHLLPNYPAPEHHHLITPDESENAGMMFAYPADSAGRYGFASQASAAYSLPDKVQGMSVLPNGDIVLSTSYGFSTSHLLTYRITTVATTVGMPEDEAVTAIGAEASSLTESTATTAPVSGDEATAAVDAEATDSAQRTLSFDAFANSTAISPYTFFVDGRSVPLYFLDSTNLVSDIEAPPMTEGIEFHDGRVWVSEESASNKYIFGKLYGAGDVFSIPSSLFAAEQ